MTLEVDTIVACATGSGPGAIAVLRVSGPQAFERTSRLLAGGLELPAPRVATLVTLVDPRDGAAVDQGLLTRFVGPDSFTGEDVVEFSGHGGSFAPALVLDAFLGVGCRLAEPGEFTRRAWLNGRLDLLQAEAIDDLIVGRSRAAHRTALGQLDRGLSAAISRQREALVALEALLVHYLDFPEEDDAPVPTGEIVRRALSLAGGLERLAGTASEGVLLRKGALVVLAGPPNAGKSSLFNALVGEERALVTEIPGTTRDAIEAEVSFGGFPFRFVDTAGLRDTEERLERLGIEVAERYLAAADLVLLCSPGSVEPEVVQRLREANGAPVLHLRTKIDLAGESVGESSGEADVDRDGVLVKISVSVEDGTGLAELRALLPKLVFGGLVAAEDSVPVLTRTRHLELVRSAASEVRDFAGALSDGVPAEIASSHLKDAATALEGMLGVVSSEEVLDALFSTFCIGK